MSTKNPQYYLDNADLLVNEHGVSNAIQSLASIVTDECSGDFPIVLSVMNGALFFAGQLIPQLRFPLEIDYIHATRYQGNIEGNQVKWIAKPSIPLKNRNVLILDDILDKGLTLKAIVDDCYGQGAKQVKTAVLVGKTLMEAKPLQADYVGLEVPDKYVFGCGMDIYGLWRNLPAIYALNLT